MWMLRLTMIDSMVMKYVELTMFGCTSSAVCANPDCPNDTDRITCSNVLKPQMRHATRCVLALSRSYVVLPFHFETLLAPLP